MNSPAIQEHMRTFAPGGARSRWSLAAMANYTAEVSDGWVSVVNMIEALLLAPPYNKNSGAALDNDATETLARINILLQQPVTFINWWGHDRSRRLMPGRTLPGSFVYMLAAIGRGVPQTGLAAIWVKMGADGLPPAAAGPQEAGAAVMSTMAKMFPVLFNETRATIDQIITLLGNRIADATGDAQGSQNWLLHSGQILINRPAALYVAPTRTPFHNESLLDVQAGVLTYIGAHVQDDPPWKRIKPVAVGRVHKKELELIGRDRFDTRLIRNLFFISNIHRLLRLKLNRELTQYRTVLVSSHSLVNPSVTEYGQDIYGPAETFADKQYAIRGT